MGPVGRGGGRNDRGYGAAPPPNAEFRVNVFGLPQTASWQDLKDHMRKAGDVSFAQVCRHLFAQANFRIQGCFPSRMLEYAMSMFLCCKHCCYVSGSRA